MQRLFEKVTGPDPLYNACRAHRSKRPVRYRLERMWRAYEPYCPDRHFLSDFRCNFVSRAWELYLANALLRRRFVLSRPPSAAPDILFKSGGRRIWIEAVAPAPGNGADAVPSRENRGIRRGKIWQGHPPTEEILLLRCMGSLVAKLQKIQDYKKRGVIRDADAVLLALTLGGIVDADVSSPDLSLGVKAAFGIGEFFMTVPVGGGLREKGFAVRPKVTKRSGRTVDARFFGTADSASISGLLYTAVDVFNAPRVAGNDLVLVHNPLATVPVGLGSLRFPKIEYYAGASGHLERIQRRPT